MINKLRILFLALWGIAIKIACKLNLIKVNWGINSTERRNHEVVVSLTSYGRRVSDVVHYAIISLLRQTYKPDKIVLWLDSENWNNENLPTTLVDLRKYGLTINFCRDLKSFKKLIPALQLYPSSLIITCDDDIWYKSDMVERLIHAYEDDPTKIYAHRAHLITYSENKINSYSEWVDEISDAEGVNVFPTSGGGTLYTRDLLHEDITKEELFMKLSPKADDVWNYFMGLAAGTKNVVLPTKGYIYLPLDVFYQTFHKDSNLSVHNCKENQNDVQIKAVMDYYGIISYNNGLVCIKDDDCFNETS